MEERNRMKKVFALILTVIIAVGGLTACTKSQSVDNKSDKNTQSADNSEDTNQKGTDSTAGTKTKIVAATGGTGPIPFVFTDNDGNLAGYDIEVLKEIFRRLPQYELEIQMTEFASIFTGMDSGLYQVGCNHLGYNEERAEKYIFTDEYNLASSALLVKKDNNEIKSINDIGSHSTEVTAASFNADWLERYNETHADNPVKLNYTETGDNYAQDVSDGIIDFYYFTKISMQQQVDELGLTNLKLIEVSKEESLEFTGSKASGNFFVVPKGYEKLADEMNKAFEEALNDGTILEISKKYFNGEDYTPTLEDIKQAKEVIGQ
jgi:polar amino acid transport system substrate-binding protein